MTRNYTESIPVELAKKLYKAGMPIETSADDEWWCPPFAEVFDWLMEKGYIIMVVPTVSPEDYHIGDTIQNWTAYVNGNSVYLPYSTWPKAANAAVEQALEILEEK